MRRLGKGARRLVMVEGPQEPHALVELALAEQGPGGDLAMEIAEAGKQLSAISPAMQRRRRCCSGMRVIRFCKERIAVDGHGNRYE